MNQRRAIEAIQTITEETGFPPSPEELADVLGVPVRNLQAALIYAKNRGLVRYDEDGNFVVAPGGRPGEGTQP